MTIQIDNSLFLPKIDRFAYNNKKRFKEQQISLANEVLAEAQHFFDDSPWVGQPQDNWDTQKECRIEMKRYILQKINIEDKRKSYFVPSFVWVFVAKMVINYIVRLIIEHYWSDLQKEIGLDY